MDRQASIQTPTARASNKTSITQDFFAITTFTDGQQNGTFDIFVFLPFNPYSAKTRPWSFKCELAIFGLVANAYVRVEVAKGAIQVRTGELEWFDRLTKCKTIISVFLCHTVSFGCPSRPWQCLVNLCAVYSVGYRHHPRTAVDPDMHGVVSVNASLKRGSSARVPNFGQDIDSQDRKPSSRSNNNKDPNRMCTNNDQQQQQRTNSNKRGPAEMVPDADDRPITKLARIGSDDQDTIAGSRDDAGPGRDSEKRNSTTTAIITATRTILEQAIATGIMDVDEAKGSLTKIFALLGRVEMPTARR